MRPTPILDCDCDDWASHYFSRDLKYSPATDALEFRRIANQDERKVREHARALTVGIAGQAQSDILAEGSRTRQFFKGLPKFKVPISPSLKVVYRSSEFG